MLTITWAVQCTKTNTMLVLCDQVRLWPTEDDHQAVVQGGVWAICYKLSDWTIKSKLSDQMATSTIVLAMRATGGRECRRLSVKWAVLKRCQIWVTGTVRGRTWGQGCVGLESRCWVMGHKEGLESEHQGARVVDLTGNLSMKVATKGKTSLPWLLTTTSLK